MAWIEMPPSHETIFRSRGWHSPTPFLNWSGVLVNRHRNRQVEQVTLDDSADHASFFLKKEYAVRWRERLRNAWHSYGWCSTAVREAKNLVGLRAAGIGCPEVAAYGEDGRQAFLLLRGAAGMTELRVFLRQSLSNAERNALADALGREIARLHVAGFDHPDLFAKHILVARQGASFRFCLLDWQRSRRRRSVGWRLRCRDWAALDATLKRVLATDRWRLCCLRAYLRATDCPGQPSLGLLARQIRREADTLRRKRNVRELAQTPVPAAQQQFVPVCRGRLLIVRAFHEELGGHVPAWLSRLVDSGTQSPPGAACLPEQGKSLRVCSWPRVASSSALWELPPLAHTLFRLHRFGIPAPRLLAAGCSATRVFVVHDVPATIPLAEALRQASLLERRSLLRQARRIVRQLRQAGYPLWSGASWRKRLGVRTATGEVSLASVDPCKRNESAAGSKTIAVVNG